MSEEWKGNYVYRFIKDGTVVYIGRSHHLTTRLTKGHHALEDFHTIEVALMESKADMYLMETYLINFYKPLLNVTLKTKESDKVSYRLPIPTFVPYKKKGPWLTDEIYDKYYDQVFNHTLHRQCIEGTLPITKITTYSRFLYKNLMDHPVTPEKLWHREAIRLLALWNESAGVVKELDCWQQVGKYFEQKRNEEAEKVLLGGDVTGH